MPRPRAAPYRRACALSVGRFVVQVRIQSAALTQVPSPCPKLPITPTSILPLNANTPQKPPAPCCSGDNGSLRPPALREAADTAILRMLQIARNQRATGLNTDDDDD